MNSVSKSWSAILIGLLLVFFSLSAGADGIDNADNNDVLKKLLGDGKTTIQPVEDDILRLTTNKDKLIRLDKDAASVIVNNPEHANVLLDSPRLLIVMPRQPGATSFSVLDADGNTILHKEIVVTNVQPNYVRIRRMCSGADASCAPTSYFYCPNGCYEVTAITGGGGNNVPPPAAAPSSANSRDGGAGGGSDDGQLQAPQNPVNTTTKPAITPGGGL